MEWKHLRALLLNRHHDRRDRRQKPNPRAAIPVTRLAALLLLSLFLELASGGPLDQLPTGPDDI